MLEAPRWGQQASFRIREGLCCRIHAASLTAILPILGDSFGITRILAPESASLGTQYWASATTLRRKHCEHLEWANGEAGHMGAGGW